MGGPAIKIKESSIKEMFLVNQLIPEFKDTKTEDGLNKRCEGRDALPIIAYVGSTPAGYILAYDRYRDGSFYCWMAGVIPKFRKKGVLKAMMDYVFAWAKERGYSKIRIKTRNTRRAMLSYLVRYGFNFVRVIKKKTIEENRIFLEKVLN